MTSLLRAEAQTYAAILVKQILPGSSLDRLRRMMRARRATARLSKAADSPPLSRERIASDLRKLGMRRGQDVLLHATLSALGPVDGGPAGVLDAIRAVAGPDATIMAPAYPMSGTMYEWMTNPLPFDVRRSRSYMGAISEHMRSLEGARRSGHPTHSVVAIGPLAEMYTARHHEGETATGPLSPFYLHMQNRGAILCLGSGVGKVTSYHVVEDLDPNFPVDANLSTPFEKTVIFEDGTRKSVRTRINDPGLSPWRVDNFKPKEQEILGLLRMGGIVSEGPVGRTTSHLLDAAALLDEMQEWSRRGITIYHRPRWRRRRGG